MCSRNWEKFIIVDKEVLNYGFSEASENVFSPCFYFLVCFLYVFMYISLMQLSVKWISKQKMSTTVYHKKIKRRSKVHQKNMSREGALRFDQSKPSSEN